MSLFYYATDILWLIVYVIFSLGQQMVPKTPRRRRYRTPTTFSVLTAMNRGSSVHVGRTCARTKTVTDTLF
jgi:hypothetical protein